jgi:hypothetical protein
MRIPILVLLLTVHALAQRPNSHLTPGKVRTTKAADICSASFRTGQYRHTTLSTKKHVCTAYRINHCPAGGRIELDHLIPLELGGADDPANLWPEFARYADGSPGFHVKDVLENELHRKVCHGEMALPEAQRCIARNWITCYRRVFGAKP